MAKTVFTNGGFDILHPGHVDLLNRARAFGDRLVVGINSDESVRRTKGNGRPIVDQEARKAVLLGLSSVDEVVIFDELTPQRIIEEIAPDVLVKGGDWPESEIVGADFVRSRGGEVHSLPLLEGYSTSKIVESMSASDDTSESHVSGIDQTIAEHQAAIEEFRAILQPQIEETAKVIYNTFKNGKKVLICGNGGSAADSQHLAAEFVGRYETERIGLPAIALTTDTSSLTAITNDYDFDRVFVRQIEALGNEGDCLIAFSTSGNSSNIIAAVMEARRRGMTVIGMTGSGGKKLAGLSDHCIIAPSARTARIQECHILICHLWCQLVDEYVAEAAN
ncbi:MAG TPA: SIS domain-containing protein [Pyrinomonadaceae bacterium]|nr:SIS domain-containing protein [Pyrinomonadaceae bacterium]